MSEQDDPASPQPTYGQMAEQHRRRAEALLVRKPGLAIAAQATAHATLAIYYQAAPDQSAPIGRGFLK